MSHFWQIVSKFGLRQRRLPQLYAFLYILDAQIVNVKAMYYKLYHKLWQLEFRDPGDA